MGLVQQAFQECDPWMYPVLVAAIVVVAVVVERTLMIVFRWGVRGDVFLAAIEKLVRGGNLERARKLVRALGTDVPLGGVVHAGLQRADEGAEAVRSAVEAAIREAEPRLRKRLLPLLGIGIAAGLLGLLGTVQLRGFDPPSDAPRPLPWGQPMTMAPLMFGAAIAGVAVLAFLVYVTKVAGIRRDMALVRERLPGLFAGRERGDHHEDAPPPETPAGLPRLGGLGLPPDVGRNDDDDR